MIWLVFMLLTTVVTAVVGAWASVVVGSIGLLAWTDRETVTHQRILFLLVSVITFLMIWTIVGFSGWKTVEAARDLRREYVTIEWRGNTKGDRMPVPATCQYDGIPCPYGAVPAPGK